MSFPLNSNDPYIKPTGERSTLGAEIGSGGGGGGGSFTPDYENDVLIIGEVDNWNYYIPMQKEYVGPGIKGYEVKTSSKGSDDASLDVYSIIYDGEILYKTLLKRVVYNVGGGSYSNDDISITYSSALWHLTAISTLYNEEGVLYSETLDWLYNKDADYIMLLEDPS